MPKLSPALARALRKVLFGLHLWFGLFVGLYFSIIGLTGSILVFEKELRPLQTPELRHVAPPAPDAKPLPVSEIMEALRRQLPNVEEEQLARIELPEHSGASYSLIVGEYADVFTVREVTLDPYTGQIITNRRGILSPLGFTLLLHIFLLLGLKGMLYNSIGGLLTALLIGTGLWLWWPATLRQIRTRLTVKRGAGAKRLAHDLHNVFGMYALPLLLLAALTGATFGFYAPVQRVVYRWTGTPEDPKPITLSPPPGARRLPLTELARIAEAAGPKDAPLQSITYPTQPEQPFAASKVRGETGFLNYIFLTIDPYTGKVLRVEDDAAAAVGPRLLRVWTMLHFGWWGGWITKILYGLAGLMPLGLFVTGLIKYLYLRRAKAANRNRRQITDALHTLLPSEKETTDALPV